MERLAGVWDFWGLAELRLTFASRRTEAFCHCSEAGGKLAFEAVVIFTVGEVCELLYAFTLPVRRGQGMALRLLAHALRDLAGEPCRRAVALEVRAGNAAAIALYENSGFLRTGVRRRYYSDGEDAILMEYELSPSAAPDLSRAMPVRGNSE